MCIIKSSTVCLQVCQKVSKQSSGHLSWDDVKSTLLASLPSMHTWPEVCARDGPFGVTKPGPRCCPGCSGTKALLQAWLATLLEAAGCGW